MCVFPNIHVYTHAQCQTHQQLVVQLLLFFHSIKTADFWLSSVNGTIHCSKLGLAMLVA